MNDTLKAAVMARAELENDLVRMISERLQRFTSDTGLRPDGVAVDLMPVHLVSEPAARYIVGAVRVDVRV